MGGLSLLLAAFILPAFAQDPVSRMTQEEKVAQMMNEAPAVERLGIPSYDWWNECLHGVARAGVATVFPQAIGLAATWDPELVRRVAEATADEARAKHHEALRRGERGRYRGLTMWSPNINIFRDPRWGRGQETYGEDPYLTSRLAVAFVKGLQGEDPEHPKAIATPKHFAVHSGPEKSRHRFDARVSERDLWETYLPAFEAAVREGGALSVMCAYNRLGGVPSCANRRLLDDILRKRWGFKGYVVSDCEAVSDIFMGHGYARSAAEASALAVRAGTDLACGTEYKSLVGAVRQGLITEDEIDVSVRRLFEARKRLGMSDAPEAVPYAAIPYEVNDSTAHRALALEAARESLVLLKNDGTLPLRKDLAAIAVMGPNADAPKVLLGNYNGTPSSSVTPLEGIRAKVSPRTRVLSDPEGADVVVLVLGLSPELEDEEGDRKTLELPRAQRKLLKKALRSGKPVVVVLMSGSALAVKDGNAILQVWYPGEEGGAAVADALFGDYDPGGRLPVTFYKSARQLPRFEDYRMAGRTYRYFKGEPLYPFGHGLSYTRFEYSGLSLSTGAIRAGEGLSLEVTVRNAGDREGDEVAQVYVTAEHASSPAPLKSLKGFSRVRLRPGETRALSFTLAPKDFSLADDSGRRVVEPGEFRIGVGGLAAPLEVLGRPVLLSD